MLLRQCMVIVNPAADRGHGMRAWQRAEPVLRAGGVEFKVVRTDGPRHAEVLAAQAARSGWPAVVAVGGDGTVHEIANGLLRAADGGPTVPLGMIAAGTGNDFVKMFGIPSDPAEAARMLLWAERVRRVDAGRIGERFFVNGVGIGFDARVAAEARRATRLRGIAVYAWGVARVLAAHRTPHMRVVVDGREVADQPLTLVTVANGGCHGGGFWLCPDARPDDGALDVLVADALPRTGVLRFVPRVLRRTHIGQPGVWLHQARQEVVVSSPEPLPVHADGEVLDAAPGALRIHVLPGRLSVLAHESAT